MIEEQQLFLLNSSSCHPDTLPFVARRGRIEPPLPASLFEEDAPGCTGPMSIVGWQQYWSHYTQDVYELAIVECQCFVCNPANLFWDDELEEEPLEVTEERRAA